MRVFLAGGTGFVGGGILERLVAQGHDVSVLSRHVDRAAPGSRVRAVAGDVADRDWLPSVRGHDAVVNAVGLIRPKGRNTFERAVVAGTRNLVDAAIAARADRFLQVSANGIEPARVPYQSTKVEAEAIVRAAPLQWTILRPSVVYGPRDDFTTRFAALMRLGVTPYFGDGRYELAPVAIEDLAAAAERALSTPATHRRTLHVCGPDRLEFRKVLAEIRDAAGRRALLLRAPKASGAALAALLGRMDWFPADRAALQMLWQGNTCPDDAWTRLLDAPPRRFRQGIRAYLGRPAPPA